ncbi:MAG: hypothetical protein ACKVPX_11810 [Myxococcaceae bacterium]
MNERWERILEAKPVPLRAQLAEEFAKLFSNDLSRWPLPVTDMALNAPNSFTSLLHPDAPRPPREVFPEAFQLTRWELAHALEAIDDYFRNRRYLEKGIAEQHRATLQFVSRWLFEQIAALREQTEGRLKNADLLQCIDRTEQHWRINSARDA